MTAVEDQLVSAESSGCQTYHGDFADRQEAIVMMQDRSRSEVGNVCLTM